MKKKLFATTKVSAAIAAVSAVGLAPVAIGQSDSGRVMEEIVIISQKREQNLQDVPVSATAFSASDIKDKNITNVSDLQYLAPGLAVQEQGSLKFINIRGVGIATVSPQTTSGVAYHIDNFFIPNEIAFSETYFDLAGIDVRRGPQGTEAGQNSTGGAMFVTTADPGYGESAFTVSGNVGTYGYQKVEGAVDIPMGSAVAMRLAGIYEQRDNYYDNIGPTSDNLDSVDRQGLRMTLAAEPSEAFDVKFKYEYTRSDSGGNFQKDLTDGIADPFTVAYGYPSRLDLDVDRATFEMNFALSDSLDLRSTTGYQTIKQIQLEDGDNTVAQVWDRYIEIEEDTIQQEINLVSNFGGAFEFVTGLFYFKDESFFYSEDFVPGQMGGPRGGPSFPAEWQVTDGKPGHESWSILAEGNFDVSDSVELILGLRYIDDTVSDNDGGYTCRACTSPAALSTEGRLITEEANTTVTTGRFVVNWNVTDDQLLYGSISRGFKSGGFNPGRYGFDPEYVDSLEIGHKATLADGGARWNNSVYFYDYEGYQLRIYDPNTAAGSSLLNTTDTSIYGLESEVVFVAGPVFGNFGLAYGKSELNDLVLPDPRNPPNQGGPFIDMTGRELSYHPKVTANTSLGFNVDVGTGALEGRFRLSYTDEQWTQIYQVEPTDYLGSYYLAHVDMEYRAENGWWVRTYINNLFDEEYIVGKRINRALRDVQYYGPPREYGVEFGWSTF